MGPKIAVLADLEGASGVRNPHECFPNFAEFEAYGVPNQEADASAAAAGLIEGGASEVVVVDGHFLGANLRSGGFSGPAHLSRGTLADELEAGGLGGVFLTGIHGKAGTPNSFGSSTVAPFVAARLNGDIIGDALLVAYLAGSFGVPLLGVSGDWVACEEVQWTCPALPTAATKTGFDRSSVRHHDPEASRAALRKVAQEAARAPAPRALSPPRRFRFELSFADEADARSAAVAVEGLATRRGRVLVFTGGNFPEAVAFAARAVGALYPGWVDGLGRRAVPAEPAGRTAGGLLEGTLVERFFGLGAPYWSD